MILTLLAVSLNDQTLSQPITAHFDGRGGTLGRADHNTMALPDPERHVSRMQAEIIASGGAYLIRNVGTANPILVGGRAVGPGETSPLTHGDEVRIGGYLLQVESRSDDAAREITRGRARRSGNTTSTAPSVAALLPPALAPPRAESVAPSMAAPTMAPVVMPTTPAAPVAAAPSGNPFADLLGPPVSQARAAPPPGDPFSDPFADLLGPAEAAPTPAPAPRPAPAPVQATTPQAPPAWTLPDDPFADFMPPAAGLPAASRALTPKVPAPTAKRLPDDFDPFASLPGEPINPAAPSAAPAGASAGYFDDLIPASPAAVSIDALFDLQPSSVDPLADFMSRPASTPSTPARTVPGRAATDSSLSTDPLQALFGDVSPAPPFAPAQPDHVPALNAAFTPPRLATVTPEATPEATPAPALAASPALRVDAPPQAWAASSQAHWAALCEGAGVQLPMPAGMGPAQWQLVGRLLHSAVEGTVRLMAVRASTKHELRAEVTVIQSRDNNPLKFSPDANTALEYLLQPPTRGFLDGPAAMNDAMHDLVGHAIGTVAGMRAAIDGMLGRFAPQALESKLTTKSMFDSLVPAQRKAKLWDLYVQHHQTIRNDAQEDFHSLFGKAFLAAYEQQIEQLKRGTAPE